MIRAREAVQTFQEQEFNEWRSHPITTQLFQYLKEKRLALMELWATGGIAGPTIEETAIRNAAAQGAVSVLEEIGTLDVNSFSEVGE